MWYPRLPPGSVYRLRHFDRYWGIAARLLGHGCEQWGTSTVTMATLTNGSSDTLTNGMAALAGSGKCRDACITGVPATRIGRLAAGRLCERIPKKPNKAIETYMKNVAHTNAGLADTRICRAVIYRPPDFSPMVAT